ncbi:hypothetical protein, conserved [Leishmania tarentolae]|uniref:Uncharacterized protein n=1 Tax=Leishmania tarentolae TaxID=5689 RepID=A0A640K992_LEITA|nr:hypothetical protein, conserved [Leishmania tarentolae]
MGNDVSLLLHADASVPDSVIATQRKVYARPSSSSGGGGRAVLRCPKICAMAAEKATHLSSGNGPANTPHAATRTSTRATEESPILLMADCAAPDAFTTPRVYVPVLNAILDYVEVHSKARTPLADTRSGGKAVCPIGIEFDSTLCLGNRLRESEARTACTRYCKLFLTHLIDALEKVGKGTLVVEAGVGVPPRLSILYLDARSCQLDDTTGQWLASSLIMDAVRRARPYALVCAGAKAVSNGEDGFMSYFSPGVKADMMWASLQHVLLAHNAMSLQGVKAVLESLLADDAMHNALLRQQGVDAKVHKSKEVMKAVTQDRLFPRPDSQLLPQLYLVDVRDNQYSDAEVQRLQSTTPDSVRGDSVRDAVTATKAPPHVPVPTTGLVPLRQSREMGSGGAGVSPIEYDHQTDANSGRYSAQCYARPSVPQGQRSKHNSTQEYMKRSSEISVRDVWDGHDGATPDGISASKPYTPVTSSPAPSVTKSTLSTVTSSTASNSQWAKKASAATPPPSGRNQRGPREVTAPAHAPFQTLSSPLTSRSELRKAQSAHQPSGVQTRPRQASHASSQQTDLPKMGVAAIAIERASGGLVIGHTTSLSSSLSPRSETHSTTPVSAPLTSETQQQTERPTSRRVLSSRHRKSSPYRPDVVETQRAYTVPKAQPPESATEAARAAAAAATSSYPTASRQRVSPPTSQGPSCVAPACHLSKLERGESDLDVAEMEGHGLLLPQRGNGDCHSPRAGGADDEPWLDEVHTQSHSRGTSPELTTASRRRFYDIAALAPPEPPFATSAAQVTPTMWKAALCKRHESPAQVASRRRTSSTSSRGRRRTAYSGVQPRVNSQRHVGNERLARAEYEAATAAEEQAREWRRMHVEQRATAGLSSGRGKLVSARRHPTCHPSPSQHVEMGMTWGRNSPLSELSSPFPAPQRPAAASSSTPTEANSSWASAPRRSTRQSYHTGATAMPCTAHDSPAPLCHEPSTTASAILSTAKRRLSTAAPPLLLPRETLTSRLRESTGRRHRYLTDVEARENAICAKNGQPRTCVRMACATAALREPWAHPLELAATRQKQKGRTSADSYCGSLGSVYSSVIMREPSPLRRGDTAPQRKASSPAHVQGSRYSSAATSTPECNENDVELVHMKLRTRARAVC